jgi:hypothetical protein
MQQAFPTTSVIMAGDAEFFAYLMPWVARHRNGWLLEHRVR